jgi:nucleoid DNA-binding protein
MSYLINEVAAELDWPKSEVKECITTFFDIAAEELTEGNEVATPYVKFKLRISPAIKKGTPTRNPSTGQTQPHVGRPAKLTLRAYPMKGLKGGLPAPGSAASKKLIAAIENGKAK